MKHYSRYRAKYPNEKIGLTTFRRVKPIQVRQITETNRRSCLCQKCCNVALKADALKKFARQMEMKDDIYEKNQNFLMQPYVKNKKMVSTKTTVSRGHATDMGQTTLIGCSTLCIEDNCICLWQIFSSRFMLARFLYSLKKW